MFLVHFQWQLVIQVSSLFIAFSDYKKGKVKYIALIYFTLVMN